MREVEPVMRIRHGLSSTAERLDLVTSDSILGMVYQLSQAVLLALVVISSIALMVGGIGVMAIMTISVTDGPGDRRAQGDRRPPRRILWQFLIEAVVLTSIGGLLGIPFGSAIGFAVNLLAGFPVSLPWWSFALGIGLLGRPSASSSGCIRPFKAATALSHRGPPLRVGADRPLKRRLPAAFSLRPTGNHAVTPNPAGAIPQPSGSEVGGPRGSRGSARWAVGFCRRTDGLGLRTRGTDAPVPPCRPGGMPLDLRGRRSAGCTARPDLLSVTRRSQPPAFAARRYFNSDRQFTITRIGSVILPRSGVRMRRSPSSEIA